MEKKSIAALIVTGAMVFGLSACGTNGATSDNADNSQSTSTPTVTEPVDTSNFVSEETTSNTNSSTEEEVEETLGIELPPVEVWYLRDYDTDGNGTISKDEWEKWCAEHPEDKNQNMHIEDSEKPQTQTPTVDTSGNPDPGSEQTSKPSTSKPSTSTPSTSKPSTSTPSTSKPSTSTPSTSTPSTSTPSTSTPSSGGDTLTEEEKANGGAFDKTVEDMGGYIDGGAFWVP